MSHVMSNFFRAVFGDVAAQASATARRHKECLRVARLCEEADCDEVFNLPEARRNG